MDKKITAAQMIKRGLLKQIIKEKIINAYKERLMKEFKKGSSWQTLRRYEITKIIESTQ